MIEPRIRIESDGTFTRLWINDVEIPDVTMLDFHAEPFWASCEYYRVEKKEKTFLIEKKKSSLMVEYENVIKKHKVNFKLKETT